MAPLYRAELRPSKLELLAEWLQAAVGTRDRPPLTSRAWRHFGSMTLPERPGSGPRLSKPVTHRSIRSRYVSRHTAGWQEGVDRAYDEADIVVATPLLTGADGGAWLLVTGRWVASNRDSIDVTALSAVLGCEVQ